MAQMRDPHRLVSISIINWNGMRYLPHCLESIYKQDYASKIEIIVVDNFSTDGSLEYLEKEHPGIKLLKNSTNRGFSYAHNQGIRASGGEYVVPLNFDVFLETSFVNEMVKTMEKDPRIGILSGKLYKQKDEKKTDILDSTGITMKHCFMSPRGEKERDNGQYDTPEGLDVFGACGCAPFYRRTMLDDVRCMDEYFDEDFVNYVEDVDLSWRALLRGWRCIYNPRAVAYHERGVTRKDSRQMRRVYLVHGFRNRYWSMIKNMTREYWERYRFKIIGREMIFLSCTIREIPRFVRIKALLFTLGRLDRMLAKRRIIQKNKTILGEDMDYFFDYNHLDLGQITSSICSWEWKNIRSKFRKDVHSLPDATENG